MKENAILDTFGKLHNLTTMQHSTWTSMVAKKPRFYQ